MKRLRILAISALLPQPRGQQGGCPALWQTANGYARAGHEFHYLTVYPPLQPVDAAAFGGPRRHVGINGWHLHKIRVPFLPVLRRLAWMQRCGPAPLQRIQELIQCAAATTFFLLFSLAAGSAAVRLARARRIDVIYAFNEYASWAAWYAARRCNALHIRRLLGSFLPQIMNMFAWPIRYPVPWMGLITPCDRLIITDDGTWAAQLAGHLSSPDRLLLWNNGVRSDLYPPSLPRAALRAQLNLPPDKKILLYLGRLGFYDGFKRTDRLAAALRRLRNDFLMVIVGPGRDADRLARYARQLGAGQVLRFVGGVSYQQVPDWYNAADLFIQLFDIANWSNSLTEAMACRLPVIVRRDASTASRLQDGVHALLVDADDLPQQIRAVQRVLDEPGLASSLARAAAKWIDRHYGTWQQRIDREIELVSQLLGAGHALRNSAPPENNHTAEPPGPIYPSTRARPTAGSLSQAGS
ncbi:MAG: glycosyltransferase family 4 protein [Phycisphaerae bacterium]